MFLINNTDGSKIVYCKKTMMEIDQTNKTIEHNYEYNGSNVEVYDVVSHSDGKIYAISCDGHCGYEITYFIYEIQNDAKISLIVQFINRAYDSQLRLYSHEDHIFVTSTKLGIHKINVKFRTECLLYEAVLTSGSPINVFYGAKIFKFATGKGEHKHPDIKETTIRNINKDPTPNAKNFKQIMLDVDVSDVFYLACDALMLKCGLYVVINGSCDISVYNPVTKKMLMIKNGNDEDTNCYKKKCNIGDSVRHVKNHEEHPNKFYIFSYYYIHCYELIFDSNTKSSDNPTTENIDIDVKIECTEQALDTVE